MKTMYDAKKISMIHKYWSNYKLLVDVCADGQMFTTYWDCDVEAKLKNKITEDTLIIDQRCKTVIMRKELCRVQCVLGYSNVTYEGSNYYIDIANIYTDTDGDSYVDVYDERYERIGSMNINRFKPIE